MFRDTAYGSELVSVISGGAVVNGEPAAIAVPVEGLLDDMMADLDRAWRAAAPGARRASVLSGGRDAGGAKFLRVGEDP